MSVSQCLVFEVDRREKTKFYEMMIKVGSNDYYLQAETREARKEWVDALNNLKKGGKGKGGEDKSKGGESERKREKKGTSEGKVMVVESSTLCVPKWDCDDFTGVSFWLAHNGYFDFNYQAYYERRSNSSQYGMF